MLDWRISCALSAGLLGCSCSHAGVDTHAENAAIAPQQATAEAAASSERGTRGAGSHGAATPPAIATPKPAPKPGRLFFDLAAHPERAELRRDGVLTMDLGVQGGAKYTFGGWLSGAGDNRVLDDASVMTVKRKRVELALPAESDAAATLTLRMRGFHKGPLTAYVNGETVGHLKLDGKALQVHAIALPKGALKRGENRLELRVSRTGVAKGIGSRAMAIDWIRLAPPGGQAEGPQPPAPEMLSVAGDDGRSLQLPDGWTLGYTVELPKAARLRGTLSKERKGTLRVVAQRDGEAPLTLAEIAPDAQAGVDIDLGALGGQVARIDLIPQGGAVALGGARVETLGDTTGPAGATRAAKAATGGERPKIENVIVVLIDTLRADKLSPYNGESRVKTPGLQTFLRHAAVMLNARTQENWTKPSVATLLSSLLPWEHNATKGESKVPNSVELLPELLRKRGYYTGSFIANGYVSDKFGFKQGWHTYRNYIREGRRSKAQYVRADVLEWLDERPKDKPFFLYMHTIDPHVPYKPPHSFVSAYDTDDYSGPVDFRATSSLLEKVKIGSVKLNKRDKRRLMALYDAEISYHDVHFAAVMEGLEKRGLSDNTMVIITSDHGEEFWDHGSVGHGHSVYDELLHVPLIVKIPGVTHGAMKLDDAVGLVDIMPTILEALGQEVPEHLTGESFLPQLKGSPSDAPRTAVSGFMRGWRTLAVGNYKLVQRTLRHTWLYNTAADPGEKTNLAPEQPLAVRYARGLLGLTLADASPVKTRASRRPRVHKKQDVHIDSQTKAQLEALGYIGSSAK